MTRGKMLRITLCILTIAVVFNGGCMWSRSNPTRQYYIINYMPQTTIPPGSKRPYEYALHIDRFEVQRIFNRQNIIYRYSPNRIQYYELERWAVRPDYMIRDVVFKHLEASRLTNHVALEFLDIKPDFRLEGTVEALEKYDAGDLFYAHLAMTFKMLRVSDGQQVWTYSFDDRRRVYSGEMVHTVAGLSAILQANMEVIIGQLDSLFLTGETGLPPVRDEAAQPAATSPDSTKSGIDESGFEIIPEKKK